MAKSRRILFLNQAPKNPGYQVDEIEALLNSYATPGTKIEIGFPDEYEGSDVREKMSDQASMNGLHHMMETPSIVRKIFWASQNGYDAVIGSNTFDPGIDGGRLAVDIPVIGPFRTTMHAATTLADRVGIINRGKEHTLATDISRLFGLDTSRIPRPAGRLSGRSVRARCAPAGRRGVASVATSEVSRVVRPWSRASAPPWTRSRPRARAGPSPS